MIAGTTELYGVVGHPVTHSLSPAIHNAAFARLGLDAVYVALPVPPERLFEAIRGAHALGFQGLNVTIPHKRRAAEIAISLDPVAAATGAVNTLRRATDGFEGFNTDAPAVLALLEAAGLRGGATALLLGAGGASRAGAWALLVAGATVAVAARRPDAAADLCAALGGAFPGGAIEPVAWERAAALAAASDVVVNGTSAGMPGHQPALPPVALRRGQIALDFVYGDTPLARAAAAAGAGLVTGEQILVRQGALAFQLWTGKPAPEGAMAAALRAAARGGPT